MSYESDQLYRFDGDTIELAFYSPDCAAVQPKVETVLEQDDLAKSGYPIAHLYKIQRDDGSATEYLTDWEDEIDVDVTYTPARIQNKRILMALNLAESSATLNVYMPDSPIVAAMINGVGYGTVSVSIYEYRVGANADPVELFTGRVCEPKAKGRNAELTISLFGGAFERELPATPYAKTCPWQIYEPDLCGVSKEAYTATGTIESISDANVLTVSDYTLPTIDSEQTQPTEDDYFAGGYAQIGDDAESRIIAAISSHSYDSENSTALLTVMPVIPDSYIGQAIEFYPGCDGSFTQCKACFANGDRFGGFPFAPNEIEGKPTSSSISGK